MRFSDVVESFDLYIRKADAHADSGAFRIRIARIQFDLRKKIQLLNVARTHIACAGNLRATALEALPTLEEIFSAAASVKTTAIVYAPRFRHGRRLNTQKAVTLRDHRLGRSRVCVA